MLGEKLRQNKINLFEFMKEKNRNDFVLFGSLRKKKLFSKRCCWFLFFFT